MNRTDADAVTGSESNDSEPYLQGLFSSGSSQAELLRQKFSLDRSRQNRYILL
jgi:hypothetical protein